MGRPRTLPAVLLATPDETEAQFYEALQQADLERMVALWSDEEEVACVHPRGARQVGLDAIRASFEEMFARGGVDVRATQVRRLVTAGLAVHHVVEELQVMSAEGPRKAWVLATNVYLKTPLGWRMIVHHASPGEPLDLHGLAEPPSTLH
jgi:uncharacterized protein (TIGR02246 family)